LPQTLPATCSETRYSAVITKFEAVILRIRLCL